MIFYGSYAAAMPHPSGEDLEMQEAIDRIIKVGWSRPTAEFRRVFTTLMIPGATEEQMAWLDELQRVAVTADVAVQGPAAAGPRRRDRRPPAADDADPDPALRRRPDERLRALPHARLAHPRRPAGPSREQQPHRARGRARLGGVRRRGDAVHGGRRSRSAPIPNDCSPHGSSRCCGWPATGSTTTPSPPTLTLSVRTVERHLQNVYAKLDLTGRNARTAAVARLHARTHA